MNNDQQLTPEEIFEIICIDTGSIHKGQSAIGRNQVFQCMERYSAQQTAAKDERIKELEEIKYRYLSLNGDLSEELEKYRSTDWVKEKDQKDARIAELEKERDLAWQTAQIVQDKSDQAFDLLERVYTSEIIRLGEENIPLIEMIQSLLSSRENKTDDQG